MSFVKTVSNLLKSVGVLTNSKETKERKDYVKRQQKKFIYAFSSGYILSRDYIADKIDKPIQSIQVETGMSPLDAISESILVNGISGDISTLLYTYGSLALINGISGEIKKSGKNALIKYGSDYCPYESYVDYKNDFRSKGVYRLSNKIELFAYSRGKEDLFRDPALILRRGLLDIAEKSSKIHRKTLNLFNKEEYGFISLVHHNKKYNNPKFVNQLIIPKDLKEQIREDLMDENNESKIESRSFTQDVMVDSIEKIKEEVMERNVNLAVVRLIDDIKQNKLTEKQQKSILNKMLKLKNNLSTEESEEFVVFDKVVHYLNNLGNIKDLKIPNYSNKQNKYERSYHIFKELDKICFNELDCKPLKKPISYRELVANELVIAVQNRLRGNHVEDAKHNRICQDQSPLYRSHFLEHKKLKSKMDRDRYGKNNNGFYKLISRNNFKINGMTNKEKKLLEKSIQQPKKKKLRY